MPTAARNIYVQSCIMEQWFGDQYGVQGMDSLSRLISKHLGTCNIGARGWGCRGQAGPPIILKMACASNGPTNMSIPRFAPLPPPSIENLPTPVGYTIVKRLKKSSRDTVLDLSR